MTPWTVALQVPLSMECYRQEYWSGLPFLSPGDLPDPVIEPRSPMLQADSLPSEPPGKPIMLNVEEFNPQHKFAVITGVTLTSDVCFASGTFISTYF